MLRGCRYVLMLLIANGVCLLDAFNIETASETRRGFVWSEANPPNVTTLEAEIGRFFGYTFQGNVVGGDERSSLSFVVGAPLQRMEKPTLLSAEDSSEALHFCGPSLLSIGIKQEDNGNMPVNTFSFNANTKDGILYSCNRKELVRSPLERIAIPSDGLGISVVSDRIRSRDGKIQSTQDHILACAHLHARNCSEYHKVEGICYLLNSSFDGNPDIRNDAKAWQTRAPCNEGCEMSKIDLIFLVDGSGTINEERFETVKDWIINIVAGFNISEPVHVGVVQYSHYFEDKDPSDQDYIKTEIEMGEHSNQLDFAAAVEKMKYQGYTTHTARAINKAIRDDFNSGASRYPGARRVMILLTDGRSSDGDRLPASVDYMRRQDVTAFAVGVGGFVLRELLLIAGSNERVFTVANFDQLQGIVDNIQSGVQLLEGSSSANTTNGLMQCQAGISSDISQVVSFSAVPASVDAWCGVKMSDCVSVMAYTY